MAMAVSSISGGGPFLLARQVSHRWKKGVSEKQVAGSVSLWNDSPRRSSCGGLLQLSAGGPAFRSSALALLKGSAERESLRSRNAIGERRQMGVSVSSSSSSAAASSVSSAEEPDLEDGGGGNGFSGRGGGRGGGGGGGGDSGFGGGADNSGGAGGSSSPGAGGIVGPLIRGWNARVKADPQFAFKVLMEEVIGVGACVLGDMATRPNFGLGELDLVFSTLVVGSILNFTLMYMLAPTAAAGAVASKLPGIFASSPPGHMFEKGSYSLVERAGTFVYKGTQFAAVGLAAGLVGTGLSNLLINARKKMDPSFVSQSASPPLLLNAGTWAIHMGLSSNARYQSLNGLEFALANVLTPATFKASVTVLRGLNNVLGGTSFVALARLTGSQPSEPTGPPHTPEGESSPLEPAIAST